MKVKILILGQILIGYLSVHAQELLLDAPEPKINVIATSSAVAIRPVKPIEKPHKFFDTENKIAFSVLAAGLAADGYTTRKWISSVPGTWETNPVAKPFVHNNVKMAAYDATAFGLAMEAANILHRSNHHKLERIFIYSVAGLEVGYATRNSIMLMKVHGPIPSPTIPLPKGPCLTCGINPNPQP